LYGVQFLLETEDYVDVHSEDEAEAVVRKNYPDAVFGDWDDSAIKVAWRSEADRQTDPMTQVAFIIDASPDDDESDEVIKQWEAEAEQYAIENCRITKPLPEYDPKKHHAVSPEEYEAGIRLSHTPSSVMTTARHECTNYDELIRGLDTSSVRDEITYIAIRGRVEEMLRLAIPSLQSEPLYEGEDGA
jgi:hypothetical protein